MIEILALTNATVWLAVGMVVFVGASTAFTFRMINGLNTDPVEKPAPLPTANHSESAEEGGVRASVATPRARKLQPPPARRPDEPAEAVPVDPLPALAAAPVKLTSEPPKDYELAKPALVPALAASASDARQEAAPPAQEMPIPPGALVLAAAGPKQPPAPAPVPAPTIPGKSLPPLAVSEVPASLPVPVARPEETPVTPRRLFAPAAPAGALTAAANPPAPASPGKGKEQTALPTLASVVPERAKESPKSTPFPDKPAPAAAVPGSSLPPLVTAAAGPVTPKAAEPAAVMPEAGKPGIERAGDGLIAISAPVKLAGGADVPPKAATGAGPDDVKKSPQTPAEPPAAPVGSGLILIPPAEAKPEPATSKAAEAPIAADTKPAEAPVSGKPAEPVLSPAVADAAPATPKPETAKPETKPEAEAKPVKGPRVFLPGKFFGRGKDKEPVAEPPAAPVAGLPKVTEPAPAVPPVEEAVPTAKADEKPAAAETPKQAEPAADKPVEVAAVRAEAAKPEAARSEPAPAAKPEETAKPAPKAPEPAAPIPPAAKVPAEKAPEPALVPTIAAVEKPVAPAVPLVPAPMAPAVPALPTPMAPTAEPMAAVLTPAVTPQKPVETPTAQPAAAPAPSQVPSITKPQSVMPPTDNTTSLPNTGRASAQLTLAFEVTSLQLTPFFKLGSVQLKALSNVVSLHLVAAQADNPLAAGISFQIDHVDLDGAAHLKSILLKPLGESRTVTAPLPKLQVDNVAVTGGGEGAPISVTTSEQASTAVQLFGTFTIAAMDFTPAFEIGSLRLEPNSNTVLLRVAPSSRPTALDLPPSFEIAAVQLGDGAQITGVRVTPSAAKAA